MIKIFIQIAVFLMLFTANAQQGFYAKKGIAVEGYDITEYFNGKAIKGDSKYSATYQKTVYYFQNEANKVKFEKAPEQYLPQYGGYCAYAIGKKGKKVKVDPETFSVENGKVYLFYNAWGTNTLDLWNKEGAKALREKADTNWKMID